MKKIKVAIVIPTHTNMKSSLHVLLGIYSYLSMTKNVQASIFTDSSSRELYKGFETVRIRGMDYNTVFSKILFFLGLPRYYYGDLINKLKGYDVIEASNPEFYIFAYQSYVAARKYNAKLILRTSQTVEGFYLFKFTKYLVVPFVKKAYDYASWLFFTNFEAAERAEKMGLMEKNSGRKVITGHAIDTKVFRPLKAKKQKNKVILSVAGLYEVKGHHLIIESLAKVRSRADAELWIAGEGYYEKNLRELAEKMGLGNKVKFLGGRTKEELAKIYNMADVFVLANLQEITPAVSEALACGIPVVVMECGGRKFVIPDEKYGLIARKFDADDMANKMLKILENKKFAERLAEKGRKRVLENFSIEKVAKKFYEAFVKLPKQ